MVQAPAISDDIVNFINNDFAHRLYHIGCVAPMVYSDAYKFAKCENCGQTWRKDTLIKWSDEELQIRFYVLLEKSKLEYQLVWNTDSGSNSFSSLELKRMKHEPQESPDFNSVGP